MHAEALLIYQKDTVAREMLYAEFTAVLDGVVSAQSFAGETLEAVYLQLDEALDITAMVFFRLPFTADGRVEDTWNLPLREMATRARTGPPLSGKKTRLMCRSQCPEKWHSWLWEPRERRGRDPFSDILRVLKRNRLGLLPAPAEPHHEEPPLITDGPEDDRDIEAELQRLQERERQLVLEVSRLQGRLDKATGRMAELQAANEKLRDYIRVLKAQFTRLKSRSIHSDS